MILQLQKSILIKRYKRFLADVILNDKTETTMHVANTGAMTGCAIANDQVWYSTSENLKRKYPYSWELTYTQDKYWICVNTIRANQLAEEALIGNKITELTQFTQLQREVKYGQEKSKIDFYLIDEHNVETYIEVKSVTLLQDNQGYFPDAVTLRGQKHLRELIEITKQGKRAVLLFAVLHSGINSVKAATHIDQEYAKLLSLAKESGVEVLAYKANFMNNNGTFNISLTKKIPVIF